MRVLSVYGSRRWRSAGVHRTRRASFIWRGTQLTGSARHGFAGETARQSWRRAGRWRVTEPRADSPQRAWVREKAPPIHRIAAAWSVGAYHPGTDPDGRM